MTCQAWPQTQLALTGLRCGEVAGLRWIDIDLNARTLQISATRLRFGKHLVEDTPKSRAGRRTLPNPDHLAAALTSRWARMLKAAGVRHIRFHDARHTCGTLMHLQDVPIAVISAWLGHASKGVHHGHLCALAAGGVEHSGAEFLSRCDKS